MIDFPIYNIVNEILAYDQQYLYPSSKEAILDHKPVLNPQYIPYNFHLAIRRFTVYANV